MPSKGNPAFKIRLAPLELATVRKYIDQLNTRRKPDDKLTVAGFLRTCITERLDKLDRGRRKSKAVAEEKGGQP